MSDRDSTRTFIPASGPISPTALTAAAPQGTLAFAPAAQAPALGESLRLTRRCIRIRAELAPKTNVEFPQYPDQYLHSIFI